MSREEPPTQGPKLEPERKPSSATPLQPWQWLLVLLLAPSTINGLDLYGDMFTRAVNGLPWGEDVKSAKRRDELFSKNMPCVEMKPSWYIAQNGAKIDATICRSGDVLVKVEPPREHNKMPTYDFMSVEALLKRARPISEASSDATKTSIAPLRSNIILAVASRQLSESRVLNSTKRSEWLKVGDISLAPSIRTSPVRTICSRRIGDGILLIRRNHPTGAYCVDSIVNTYTGQTESARWTISCDASCS